MAKVIYNDIIPFKGFQAITIFPVIFARNSAKWLKDYVVNHESTHLAQQFEVLVASVLLIALLGILFDISMWWLFAAPLVYFAWYGTEYVIRLFVHGNGKEAYRNICFEQEAFINEKNLGYLCDRKAFAWVRYITTKTYRKR